MKNYLILLFSRKLYILHEDYADLISDKINRLID